MSTTDAPARVSPAPSTAPRLIGSLVLGVVVGLIGYYLIAVAATAQIPGAFTINPLALVVLAVVTALAVVVGWRWPIVGLTAGILVLVLVAFAVAGRMAWSSTGSAWLNPFNAVAFGAASGYPTMLGAVMITVSALRLRSRRAH